MDIFLADFKLPIYPSHPQIPTQLPQLILIALIIPRLSPAKATSVFFGGVRIPRYYEIWFIQKSGEDLTSHRTGIVGASIGPNPAFETPPAVLGDGIPVFSRFLDQGRPLLGIRMS